MGSMFQGCSNLTELNLTSFGTQNVADMYRMFQGCSSLTELNLSGFDTQNVTGMSNMFSGCSSLTELNLSSFATRNVTSMYGMFSECRSLAELNLSNFDISNITRKDRITWFVNGCGALKTIYAPYNLSQQVLLPGNVWYRSDGTIVTELPQNLSYSVALGKNYIPEEKITQNEVIELKDGECAVFIYDISNNSPIENATVTIDGNVYTTVSNGTAVFPAPDEPSKREILVHADRYIDTVTYQQIKNKNIVRIALEPDTGGLKLVSASASLSGNNYDVLREKLVLGYAENSDDFTNKVESTLNLKIRSNKENVTYEIFSSSNYLGGNGSGGGGGGFGSDDSMVLFTSSTGDFSINVITESVKLGKFEIAQTAVTDLIEPGKKMYVKITDSDGNSITNRLNITTAFNYLTQEKPKDSFKLGNELKVSVPEDVPFIGGNDFVFGFEDEMPVEVEIDEDGKIKISYNKPADIDMDKFSKKYKDLEKKAGRVAKLTPNIAGVKRFGAGMIDVSGKVCGYGEGNISEIKNGNPTIKLGIMAEIEGTAGYKHYWVIGFVPVKLFIEGKAQGSAALEAGIKFENWKIKEFDISGGSLNVTLQLDVGGGVGFGYVVEASLTGKINYTIKPARNHEKLWLEASGKVQRVLLGMWEETFWQSDTYKYTLYQKGTDTPVPFSDMAEVSEFNLSGRTYLDYAGYHSFVHGEEIVPFSVENAQNEDIVVKSAVLPAANPILVEADNVKYLFWLDDIATRDAYNRTALMWSKSSDGINWSEPKQLIEESEDDTLDGSCKVFVDGGKIYLTWQDAVRQLTQEDDILNVLKSLSVRCAVLDITEDSVIENKCLTQDTGYYMYPCTVAAGNEIYSAYVHNMLDTGAVEGNNMQHLYVVEGSGGTKEVTIPENAQIANMDAGIFGGKPQLVCELDMDGDPSTDTDREIYIYDFQAERLSRVTDNEVMDTMPVISDSGNIYWFQDTKIVKLAEETKMPESIWSEQQLAYQSAFTVATDVSGKDTILWEASDTGAEDGSVAIFQTAENSDGSWGDVVRFSKTTGTISSGISAAGSGDNLQVAHTEGIFLTDGTALKDLCVTGKENTVDIAVEYVEFDEKSVSSGNPVILKAGVINNGNAVVNELEVSVNDEAIANLTGLALKPSESRELEISGFTVPSSLRNAETFSLKLIALGEANLEDNATDFMLGCSDTYVETNCRIAGERTWIDINIWNDSSYEASGQVLVHKSDSGGEVIYSKDYNGLGPENGFAYSVDLGDYENENVKYYVEVTTDGEENKSGNNLEFVYIGYGTGIEEEEAQPTPGGTESISLDNNNLMLNTGDMQRLCAKDDEGNEFEDGELLWSSGDSRIASVDQQGLIKAHRAGQVEITAYYGDISSTCNVTVNETGTKTFTVWFNTQGGNTIAPIKGIVPGSTVSLPVDVKKAGFAFEGWYTQPEGGEKADASEYLARQSITLYAHWINEQLEDRIWVENIEEQIYTGKILKPQIKVHDGIILLKEKTDYTISYKNNKAAYTYLEEDYAAFEQNLADTGKRVKTGSFDPAKAPQVVIKMKGNYSGSQIIYFQIHPEDITGEAFAVSDLSATYTGKKQTPTPVLAWNGKALKYGTDFYIPEYDNAKSDKSAFKEPGAYTLTVTGKKNFTGEIPVTFTISASVKQIAMNKVTVKGIKNQPWTGEQVTQSGFTVSYKKDILAEGSGMEGNEEAAEKTGDYTVTYGENISAGTGTITFTGTGVDADGDGYSYIGTRTMTFKITGTAMSKVTVSGVEKSYTYTGEEIQPSAVLTYKANKNAEPVTLTEGTHYTVTYQKNKDKGTASIIFTGLARGGYTGTKKQTFKIVSSGIADKKEGETTVEQISVAFKETGNIQDGVYVAPYMKGGAKPEVLVTSGRTVLTAGKDYTVSYANNKKVALSTDKKAPTVTVKGKGNYAGTKQVSFTIAAKALTNENGIRVVAKDKVASTKKNGYRQAFKVYDADGKALGSGDYDTKNVSYTLIQMENADGTVTERNDALDKNSTVPAGAVIQITVQGKGAYEGGTATGTYRILEGGHDISRAVIQINNQAYTGRPVKITGQEQFKEGKVYIKIGKTSRVLTLGEDIEVVPDSYVKNINKGTAKVTFRGINEFGGTKTVSYKIGVRSIGDFWKGIVDKVTGLFAGTERLVALPESKIQLT